MSKNFELTKLIYEGKAKQLWEFKSSVFNKGEPNLIAIKYKDDTTAGNGERKEIIEGKGRLTFLISTQLLNLLSKRNISTHLCDIIDSENIQIVRRLTILPLEIIVRNIATGSFSKRYGIPDDGSISFEPPLIEFCLKDDTLGDPFILPEAAKAIGLLSFKTKLGEIIDIKESTIKSLAFLINFELQDIFKQHGITLVDFKIELGVDENGKVYLADEISPDTCRFWDMETKKKLDKDVFRQRTGDLIEAYSELLNNLTGGNE